MKPVTLSANGCTAMNAGINLALDKLKERIRLYNEYGNPCFKPWVVMITDGCSTDDVSEAASRIRKAEARKFLKFWSVGTSGYDLATLVKLSTKPRVLELPNNDYVSFFDWISENILGMQCSPMISVELPKNIYSIKIEKNK